MRVMLVLMLVVVMLAVLMVVPGSILIAIVPCPVHGARPVVAFWNDDDARPLYISDWRIVIVIEDNLGPSHKYIDIDPGGSVR